MNEIAKVSVSRTRRHGNPHYQKASWIAQLQPDRKTWRIYYKTA